MNPGLKHQVREDGSVLLTLTDATGFAVSVPVSPGHAKARAWGLLADLDPDSEDVQMRPVIAAGDAVAGELRPSIQIMIALEKGPATNLRLRGLTGLAKQRMDSQLASHVKRGRVSMSRPNDRAPAVYDITHAGFQWLNPRRPA